MDPNVTLETIRTRASDALEYISAEAAFDVVYAIQDLDQWLSKGGFLPTAWESA